MLGLLLMKYTIILLNLLNYFISGYKFNNHITNKLTKLTKFTNEFNNEFDNELTNYFLDQTSDQISNQNINNDLQNKLKKVPIKESFILIGGNTNNNINIIKNTCKLMLKLSLILTHGLNIPIINIGFILDKTKNIPINDKNVQKISTILEFMDGVAIYINPFSNSQFKNLLKLFIIRNQLFNNNSYPFINYNEEFMNLMIPYITPNKSLNNNNLVFINYLDLEYIDYLMEIKNQIGISIDNNNIDDVNINNFINKIKLINPNNLPEKIIIIINLNSDKLKIFLPQIIKAIQKEELSVIWCYNPIVKEEDNELCDLDYDSNDNLGDYSYDNEYEHIIALTEIKRNIKTFYCIHKKLNSYFGGLYLEFSEINGFNTYTSFEIAFFICELKNLY